MTLREALVLTNPEKMFGPRRERWEYVEGELVVTPAEGAASGEAPSAPGTGTGNGGKAGGGGMGGGPPKGPPPEPAAPPPA
jgi:hypothetical protein